MNVQRRRRAKPMQQGRKAPYVIVHHWIAFHPELAAQSKAVYLVMLCYANGDSLLKEGVDEVWPAREAIAEACGWSRPQSVDKWIDQLVKVGAVTVLPPEPGEPDRNNHYLVHATPPEGYQGLQTQAEFSAARRAKRGDRKGESNAQVSEGCAAERITPMGGTAERITQKDDALQRTEGCSPERIDVVRQSAHEQEPRTRTKKKEEGGYVGPVGHQRERTPETDPPPPPSHDLDPHNRDTWRCPAHWGGPDPGPCPHCGDQRRRAERLLADEVAADAVVERVAQKCQMCRPDRTNPDGKVTWLRVFPGTQEPVTPYLKCDHETSHSDAVAAMEARELAREAEAEAIRNAPKPPPVPLSPVVNQVLADVRAKLSKHSTASSPRGRARRQWVDDGSPRPARADKLAEQARDGAA